MLRAEQSGACAGGAGPAVPGRLARRSVVTTASSPARHRQHPEARLVEETRESDRAMTTKPRRYALLAILAASACVSQSKYDRALGVMSQYQADRLEAQADRDAAVAKVQAQLETQAGVLSRSREQAEKERAAMQGELAASREEMEAVRAQRALTEQR